MCLLAGVTQCVCLWIFLPLSAGLSLMDQKTHFICQNRAATHTYLHHLKFGVVCDSGPYRTT